MPLILGIIITVRDTGQVTNPIDIEHLENAISVLVSSGIRLPPLAGPSASLLAIESTRLFTREMPSDSQALSGNVVTGGRC
jgi:hypothetical protein